MHLVKLETSPDLVERVYQALVNAISDGTLTPGERVMQEDLAARFNVSRQPVLQALKLLRKDGLVLDAPGRGLMVAALDADLIEQVYQVRAMLDALAARLAAKRRAGIDAGLIARGRKAVQGKNVRAMIEADAAFHQAIYVASGNPLIAQSAQLHWRHVRRAMGATLQRGEVRESVWDEHAAIAQAIAAGDAQRAERLSRTHGDAAGAFMAMQIAHAQKQTEHQNE